MRRKGIPGNCCGDTCGNKVRKINGISPDPNGEFTIEAGDGVAFTELVNGFKVDVQGDIDIISAGENIDIDDQGNEKVISLTNEIVGDHLIKDHITLDSGNSGSTHYTSLDMQMEGNRSSRPTNGYGSWIRMFDGNGQNEARMSYYHTNDLSDQRTLELNTYTGTSVPGGSLKIVTNPQQNESHLEGVSRPYDTANENDIVTIGSLKNSTDVLRTQGGNQSMNGRLTIGDRIITNTNLNIEDITGSTYISGFEGQLKISDVMSSLGSLNIRRYANRTRMLFYLRNLGGDELRYIIEKFDSNRVYVAVENVVSGVTTNHVLLDSTP